MSGYTSQEIAAHRAAAYDALRSGDFLQGRTALAYRDPDGDMRYCCLGVLCEVARKAGLNVRLTEDLPNHFSYDGGNGYLPESVRKWYRITVNNPQLPVSDTDWVFATEANDIWHYSFDQIADMFEDVYPSTSSTAEESYA